MLLAEIDQRVQREERKKKKLTQDIVFVILQLLNRKPTGDFGKMLR